MVSESPSWLFCLGFRARRAGSIGFTWRVGGLSKWVISRLRSTLKGVLIGVMILTSLQSNYLLIPPTLKVGLRITIKASIITNTSLGVPCYGYSRIYAPKPYSKY